METKKSYYEQNKEKCKQRAKEYIAKHKDKHAEYMKKSYKKNKPKRNEYLRKYKQKQYHSDEQTKIKAKYMAYHNFFLKGDYPRMRHFVDMDLNEYMDYIQTFFETDMNWNNRGKKWRIVRKKSFKEFNLNNEEELKKFFNYNNIVVQRING